MTASDSKPDLHELCEPIAWLLGTWRGRGEGRYPTIKPFTYDEEIRFWHDGRPLLFYAQTTRSPEGSAMHAETGFFRPQGGHALEAVFVHSFGAVEIEVGTALPDAIDLLSAAISSAPSAKHIDALTRAYRREGAELSYEVGMDFGGEGLQSHLSGRLTLTS